jgi:hypothetical protein
MLDLNQQQIKQAAQRRAVVLPGPHAGSSKNLQNEFSGLRERSDRLESSKGHIVGFEQKYVDDLDSLISHRGDSVEVASFSEDAGSVHDFRIWNLRTELAVRRDVFVYLRNRQAEASQVAGKLRESVTKARVDVTAKLIEAGYSDPAADKLGRCRVTELMINSHPDVIAAQAARDAAKGASRENLQPANTQAIADLERLIRKFGLKLAGLS